MPLFKRIEDYIRIHEHFQKSSVKSKFAIGNIINFSEDFNSSASLEKYPCKWCEGAIE